MKTTLILTICALAASTGLGRINETLEQCQARYGSIEPAANGAFIARSSGFMLYLQFEGGKCSIIGYSKIQKDALGNSLPLTRDEKDILLNNNIGSGKYSRQSNGLKEVYISNDGQISAQYDVLKNLLVFTTTTALQKEAESQKAKTSEEMSGL